MTPQERAEVEIDQLDRLIEALKQARFDPETTPAEVCEFLVRTYETLKGIAGAKPVAIASRAH